MSLSEADEINRFLPYIQMHELEALLFSSPRVMAAAFERPDLAFTFAEIVRQCGACEEINDKSETAPSRRIAELYPAYRKGSSAHAHAPIIAKRIGLATLREACPHFDAWMTTLERLE